MSLSNDTSRREFLQNSIAVAGTAAMAGTVRKAVAQPAGKRPNIVFFFGEGQRADALSIEGHPILKTPNHDRIGAEGVRFRNAFCTNALCAPARATALTGQYSRTTGALANEGVQTVPLPADIPIFTDLLKKEGYDIAMLGKVHVRNGVEERGWDYYFGHNAPGNNYENPFFKEGNNGVVGPQKQYFGHYPDDLTVDKALEWLDSRGDTEKPFCILIWFVAPHAPFYRARRHLDLYNGTPIPKPDTFDDDLKGWPGKPKCFQEARNKVGTTVMGDDVRSLEELHKDYYAGLVAVDENIGRVFQWLEKKNVLDDTAIMQGSDHGYFMGEWRCFDKRLMHEPSIRVPLMMRFPKRIPAGTVRNEMVLDTDIAPTLLDLAGVPIPAKMQGKSLMPLTHQADSDFRKEWFYEYFEWPNPEMAPPCRGIRAETAKLIHYTKHNEWEMYDLKADPGEKNNLYGKPEHADMQANLLARMEKLDAGIPHGKKLEPQDLGQSEHTVTRGSRKTEDNAHK